MGEGPQLIRVDIGLWLKVSRRERGRGCLVWLPNGLEPFGSPSSDSSLSGVGSSAEPGSLAELGLHPRPDGPRALDPGTTC